MWFYSLPGVAPVESYVNVVLTSFTAKEMYMLLAHHNKTMTVMREGKIIWAARTDTIIMNLSTATIQYVLQAMLWYVMVWYGMVWYVSGEIERNY